MIIAEESYETSEPSIDGHIVKLKATGADVFLSITTPKFAAQAIKKLAEIDWKPMHIVVQRLGLGRRRDQAGRLRELRRACCRPPTPRTAPIRSGTTIPA